MKTLIVSAVALAASATLALAETPKPATAPSTAVALSDSQMDNVVGGWCGTYFPSGTFEGQPVYEVAHGEGAIVCSLKPNGGIPLVIFTGHLGGGQVIIIGDQGTAR